MKKRIFSLVAVLLAAAVFSGCGLVDAAISLIAPDVTESNDLPHLMVQRLDVTMNPPDADYVRHYQTQENLTATLQMLRDMATNDVPEEEPTLSGGQTYYTITATYASGEQQRYYLLGYRFLKIGDEPWCEISYDSAMNFTRFILENQSDEGSYVPPPTEPTVPAETTTPSQPATEPQTA